MKYNPLDSYRSNATNLSESVRSRLIHSLDRWYFEPHRLPDEEVLACTLLLFEALFRIEGMREAVPLTMRLCLFVSFYLTKTDLERLIIISLLPLQNKCQISSIISDGFTDMKILITISNMLSMYYKQLNRISSQREWYLHLRSSSIQPECGNPKNSLTVVL